MPVQKPTKHRTVSAHIKIQPPEGILNIYAPQELHEEIGEFGTITTFESDPTFIQLKVDPRYNFNEVTKYINNNCEEPQP